MYAIERIWASRVGQKSPPALASVLRAVSASRTAAAPTNCTTAALGNQGANALSWNQNEVTPFLPIPAAVLVVLIDPGARPHPLGDCVTSTFSADPVYWIPLQRKFRLGQTRFLMIATPDGRISRYLYGVDYAPRDLRLALVEASERKIGSPVDELLLFCYHYDPATGKYGAVVMNIVRLAGGLTVVLIAGLLLVLKRRSSRAGLPPQLKQADGPAPRSRIFIAP